MTHPPGPELFTAAQVCTHLGVQRRALAWWTEVGLIARRQVSRRDGRPATGQGTVRVYDEADLERIRVIDRLVRAGICLGCIRKLAASSGGAAVELSEALAEGAPVIGAMDLARPSRGEGAPAAGEDRKRTCSEPGCSTILSRYNPTGERCSIHGG